MNNSLQKQNLEILALINAYLLTHPNLRFEQALCNLGLDIADYYGESEATLARVRRIVERP